MNKVNIVLSFVSMVHFSVFSIDVSSLADMKKYYSGIEQNLKKINGELRQQNSKMKKSAKLKKFMKINKNDVKKRDLFIDKNFPEINKIIRKKNEFIKAKSSFVSLYEQYNEIGVQLTSAFEVFKKEIDAL